MTDTSDTPATPDEYVGRGHTIPPHAQDTMQGRLNAGWRALMLEVRTIPASLAAQQLTEADVIDVVCAAVARVVRNPDGLEQESSSIDDYQESRKHADATEDLYFTAAEKRRLSPVDDYAGGWSGSAPYC